MFDLKSKTQNEINRKNFESNHYYDEINHLSYLDCSTAAQKNSKRHQHSNQYHPNLNQYHPNQLNAKRSHVNRKNIATLDNQPNHNRLNCKQCLKNKNQETIKPSSKNKSYSTNTIKFKDIIDEDFYYDDDDLLMLNETQVGIANKEVKLNKSETINCGTFCSNNNNNNNLCNNSNSIDSNFVTKLNTNFRVDVENYENFNQINDEELLFNNNRNSQNLIMKQTGIARKSDDNNINNNHNMLKNNELNETTSSISSFFYPKNINIKSNSDNLKQKSNNQIETKKSSKFADYSIDKLSITFSSFSSPSSSSSSASLVVDLNNSLSLTNSAKSVASSKTVTEAKMQSSTNTTTSDTRLAETKSTSTDDQTQFSLSSDKLKLHTLIDSVGFLLFPSAKFVNLAYKELLKEYNLYDILQ